MLHNDQQPDAASKTRHRSGDKKPLTGSNSSRGEDRNFRVHYYEALRFRGVDEKKTLEVILKEDPLNLEKCIHFALRCNVPSANRALVWKLILGIESRFPASRTHYYSWKVRSYQDCKRLLTTASRIDESWSSAQILTVIWLLCRFKSNANMIMDKNFACESFMAIAESMLPICQKVETDAFYLSIGLWNTINGHPEEVFIELVQQFHRLLAGQSAQIYSHMDKIGLSEEIPIRQWIAKGYSGVLHSSALERLWDKLVCGALNLLVYVGVALVQISKSALMACETASEGIRCLIATSEETDESIVHSAIESWDADGATVPESSRRLDMTSGTRMGATSLLVGNGSDCSTPILNNPFFDLAPRINVEALQTEIIQEEDEGN